MPGARAMREWNTRSNLADLGRPHANYGREFTRKTPASLNASAGHATAANAHLRRGHPGNELARCGRQLAYTPPGLRTPPIADTRSGRIVGPFKHE